MRLRDRLQRRVIPRAIVALSTVRLPARSAATLRRVRGGTGRVELYVAFDDPNSAVAVLALAERVGRRPARLRVDPVVARGIPHDPAVDAKRRYAVVDARRLAARTGLELERSEPIPASEVAFLARWAAAIPDPAARARFCTAAMRRLWFESDGPVTEGPYSGLWQELVGGEPPVDGTEGVARVERRMLKRGLYDTPIAVVGRQWFFAHERLDQIENRLDELGWVAA